MAIPIAQVVSHWSHFYQSFALSADTFYTELATIIKSHEMPDSRMGRVRHKEAGVFSAEREYLRIKHNNLVFDVCAAPFGKNFFISWWLYETEGSFQSIFKSTTVGNFLAQRAAKRTFFQADIEEMFRSCVHECILEAVNKVAEGKGIRALTESEKAYRKGGL